MAGTTGSGGQHDVQRVQLAVQRVHQLRAGAQDLPVEIRGLGMRMRRIDGREHARAVIQPPVLHQQHRDRAQAQQLPVGVGQQPARRDGGRVP